MTGPLAAGGGGVLPFPWPVIGITALAGLLLLLAYGRSLARGRDLLPRGPRPAPRAGVFEALAVVVLSVLVPAFLFGVAGGLGLEEKGDAQLLGTAGAGVLAVLAWGAWLRRGSEHGPRGRGALAGALAWLAWFPVVLGFMAGWRLLLDAFGYPWREQAVLTALRGRETTPWVVARFFLLAVILAPLVEEVIFRGLLFGALRRRWGLGAALVISSAVFGLVHLDLYASPAIFVLSLGLGWVYERTGTLAAPVAFHAVFNGWTFLGVLVGSG